MAALGARIAALEKQAASQQQALRSSDVAKHQIDTRMLRLENENTQLHNDVSERDSQIAQFTKEARRVQADLDNLTSAKAVNEVQIQTDKAELDKLQDTISALTQELNESQHLSDAANQAKDLIVARNLHIVDVFDHDGREKDVFDHSGQEKNGPFGRIFYTEGKNLIFYAYDLSDSRKFSAKINFHVWGSREGANQKIRSLGIFHTDDAKAGRWVLKFDDPNVLAQINWVFVTVESQKKVVTHPSGDIILSAHLGSKPNHP